MFSRVFEHCSPKTEPKKANVFEWRMDKLNPQVLPEGVQRYVERWSLFIVQRQKEKFALKRISSSLYLNTLWYFWSLNTISICFYVSLNVVRQKQSRHKKIPQLCRVISYLQPAFAGGYVPRGYGFPGTVPVLHAALGELVPFYKCVGYKYGKVITNTSGICLYQYYMRIFKN